MNKIFLQGRIVKGPKASMMANGKAICHFDISVLRAYRKEGEEPKYDYFNCVAFRGIADLIASHFGRGDYIIVIGPVYNNNYESDGHMNYGKQVVVNEIDFRMRGGLKIPKGHRKVTKKLCLSWKMAATMTSWMSRRGSRKSFRLSDGKQRAVARFFCVL